MHSYNSLLNDLNNSGINNKGTLLVHSSMKAIGRVEGGADTVLDVLINFMQDGLLILPTHTWDTVDKDNPIMDVKTTPSCVGLLTNMFMKREGVLRSLHPTHSVAAIGKNAKEYLQGEENATTPAPRNGCWGRLYDLDATIMFLGCPLTKNTFIHSVEEWLDIPWRLFDYPVELYTVDYEGVKHTIPQYKHNESMPSEQYDRMENIFISEGAVTVKNFGDAKCYIGSARKMAELTIRELNKDPRLFDKDNPRFTNQA